MPNQIRLIVRNKLLFYFIFCRRIFIHDMIESQGTKELIGENWNKNSDTIKIGKA